MADDYQDLGSTSIAPIVHNWAKNPESSFELVRWLHKYEGSAMLLETVTGLTPLKFNLEVFLNGHAELYEILDFWTGVYGRVGRFWIPHPKQFFTLKSNIDVSSSLAVCEGDVAASLFSGHERVYMYLSNGDWWTRQVISATYDNVDNETELTLNNTAGRLIEPADILLFGRMLLCRFDQDSLEMKIETDDKVNISFRLYELVQEYSEV